MGRRGAHRHHQHAPPHTLNPDPLFSRMDAASLFFIQPLQVLHAYLKKHIHISLAHGLGIMAFMLLGQACANGPSASDLRDAAEKGPANGNGTSKEEVYAWQATSLPCNKFGRNAESLADSNNMLLEACFQDIFDKRSRWALLQAYDTSAPQRADDKVDDTILMRAISLDRRLFSEDSGLFIMVRHPVRDYSEWSRLFTDMEYFKELDSVYTVGVFRDLKDSMQISVLNYCLSETGAVRYANLLHQGRIMESAGVTEPIEAQILELTLH